MSAAARRVVVALLLALPAAAGERTVAVDSPLGPVKIEAREDGAVLMFRVPDGIGVEDSSRALDALLGQLAEDLAQRAKVSIDMGRIAEHPWLSHRLAEAAFASPRWDAKRGKPRGASDNAVVADLVESEDLVAPWRPIFARHGFAVRGASVEKVLFARAGAPGPLAALAAGTDASGRKLPFDAILWLRLERTTP